MINRISILAAGYLGFPLAQELKGMGKKVKLASRDFQKRQIFNKLGFETFHVELQDPAASLEFFDTELLIICLPPSSYPDNYVEVLSNMMEILKEKKPKKILYTSSTSVYEDGQAVVDESSALKSKDNTANRVVLTEEIIKASGLDYIILRLGGLVGGNRHPIKHLSGRKDIKGKYHPVNLLHLQDAIASILHLIKAEHFGEIFNCCCPEHPLKKDYYTAMAQDHALNLPLFDEKDLSKNKIVDSSKLINSNFNFIFTDPYEFPKLQD